MLAKDLLCVKGFVNFNNLYANNKVYKLYNLFVPIDEMHHGFFQIRKCNGDWYGLIRKIVLDKTKVIEGSVELT